MTRSKLLKLLLVVSGLVAMAIGGSILTVPDAFYASSGITLSRDANLMSEIRAPGGALLGSGALILLGAFLQSFAVASLTIGATVYLSYGASRLLSMAVDGLPGSSLIVASGVELAIGALCLYALLRALPSLRNNS